MDAQGLRGTKATRDFKAGEAVAVLPYSRAWHVGPKEWTSAVCLGAGSMSEQLADM